MDNPDRILSSTPPAHAQHVHRTLNVSPINLQTPPGFVYPQHEQGSNQANNTKLNRNAENDRAQVNQNKNPQGTQNGLRAPPRNPHVNMSEQFRPIKGTEYLPMSVPGCILTTREDQKIASEMWLKATLDLTWEATGHIPRSVLITHLQKYNFHSQAITPFILERIQTNVLLWP